MLMPLRDVVHCRAAPSKTEFVAHTCMERQPSSSVSPERGNTQIGISLRGEGVRRMRAESEKCCVRESERHSIGFPGNLSPYLDRCHSIAEFNPLDWDHDFLQYKTRQKFSRKTKWGYKRRLRGKQQLLTARGQPPHTLGLSTLCLTAESELWGPGREMKEKREPEGRQVKQRERACERHSAIAPSFQFLRFDPGSASYPGAGDRTGALLLL